jgi:hypothetical protein
MNINYKDAKFGHNVYMWGSPPPPYDVMSGTDAQNGVDIIFNYTTKGMLVLVVLALEN